MKFALNSASQTGNRRKQRRSAAVLAQVEILEQKRVLTPQILTPVGTVTDSTPEITWEAEDGAVSYDLWISSLDAFETIQTHIGADAVTGTSFTPTEPLSLGRIRVWVRARFEDDSTTDWSSHRDFQIESVPEMTGPVGAGSRNVVIDTTPTFTWTSANDAFRFQIFIRDETTVTGKTFTIDNTDAEVRSWTLPDADALKLGAYTSWVRSIDLKGRVSEWSDPFRFDSGPTVTINRPAAPTFLNPPVLQWNALTRATHYEVYVSTQADTTTPLYREIVDTNSYTIPDVLPVDDYIFWIRAISRIDGKRDVVGGWNGGSEFSTLKAPVITAPTALITEARPTLTWTPIDGTARYEIEIARFNSPAPFLETVSRTTSFTFTDVLPAGNYVAWVRAVSTRGTFSAWSAPHPFQATGGAPLITSPAAGPTTDVTPDFVWEGVDGAETYEIFVAHLGVDFTFINVDGLTTTSYTHPDPFATGTYRVWVRAIFADSTMSPWSAAVTIDVAFNDQSLIDTDVLLARVDVSLESPHSQASANDSDRPSPTAESRIPLPENLVSEESIRESSRPENGSDRPLESDAAVPPGAEGDAVVRQHLPAEMLQRLAEECTNVEWWTGHISHA